MRSHCSERAEALGQPGASFLERAAKPVEAEPTAAKHPTPNIQHPTPNEATASRRVRCSALLVVALDYSSRTVATVYPNRMRCRSARSQLCAPRDTARPDSRLERGQPCPR